MKIPHEESTYALLVRSEEKSRSVLEVVLYAFFILSAVFSIWQFANQPNALPLNSVSTPGSIACQSQNGHPRLQC